ncbi:PIN domain-containing protein [Granulicatella elegans]|uniref:PIN domain-containing protein n=1 Tax=Granulicatella elegans ATCC 700633 TaxID=626369 RepID=D0BLK2_9LACT|nr:PIN/TRAM domain-containing protein [Granulicatella elegans]EEW92867.2 hypothetical protein HMPREF0446_00855 [Granulicatella elegans ATCC 700633]
MDLSVKGQLFAKRMMTLIFVILGGSLGVTYLPSFWELIGISNEWLNSAVCSAVIGAIIFFFISLVLTKPIMAGFKKLEKLVNQLSVTYLVFGLLGTLLGLVVASFISLPLTNLQIPAITQVAPVVLSIIFGYLGFYIGTSRRGDFHKLLSLKKKTEEPQVLERKVDDAFHKYKILDTSVIIDGRIYDIAQTGFLEGVLVIPIFVLNELQYIADSSDSVKRVRGRRGLDILNALQKESKVPVETYDGDYDDITEVDRKLIRLAKSIDGVIITNDYNLNKVSEFQNVPVFNINALANAIKPVVIPGEMMKIQVIKAGTERQQGVAYMDDGTMIVVEDGQYYMNQEIDVIVTSALQTAAGRMIFAKPAHSQKKMNRPED